MRPLSLCCLPFLLSSAAFALVGPCSAQCQANVQFVYQNAPALGVSILAPCSQNPVFGSTWCPAILHGHPMAGNFMPNAVIDFYVVAAGLAPVPLPLPPIGTVLIDPGLVIGTFTSLPGERLMLQIPNDPQLCGFAVAVQGVGFDAVGVACTNAVVGTIGN